MTQTQDCPQAPFDGRALDRAYLLEKGRELQEKYRVQGNLFIGYGNSSFWNGDFQIAAIGYEAPGGPAFLASGKRVGSFENVWYPLVGIGGDSYAFCGHTLEMMALCTGLVNRTAFIPESLSMLIPRSEGYLEWLGFLAEVNEHPEGVLRD